MSALLAGRLGGWLCREWIGLPLAALLGLLGWVLAPVGMLLWLPAAPFALGNCYHLLRLGLAHRRWPPAGRFVQFEGRNLHLLTEGQAQGWPALLWLPGGYSQGLFFAHGHAAFRGQTRSILLDPPGQGYSANGPFPRSVERVVDEIASALEAAGETGPFVLIGHSFGGLLAANLAARFPARVRGLICLDATPPDTLAYPSQLRPLGTRAMLQDALLALLGLRWHRPDEAVYESGYKQALAPWWPAIRANENRLSTHLSMLSAVIGAGLHPDYLVRSPGALGELPLLSITQPPTSNAEAVQEIGEILKLPEWKRTITAQMLADTDQHYARLSRRGRHLVAPEGTDHNFPYQAPDFVFGEIRKFLDSLETTG